MPYKTRKENAVIVAWIATSTPKPLEPGSNPFSQSFSDYAITFCFAFCPCFTCFSSLKSLFFRSRDTQYAVPFAATRTRPHQMTPLRFRLELKQESQLFIVFFAPPCLPLITLVSNRLS
ncbi:hypothetical protein L596_009204 [Steinernema carpocapsae]|uniref:Uncharacterized protein n=1 Tax=Steinernema carpocapsae TaxID=34508 RepID=A0A4U5PEN8_STECR|nr:hypothetical protein L596_009204 [Steinernema carpocapsae]